MSRITIEDLPETEPLGMEEIRRVMGGVSLHRSTDERFIKIGATTVRKRPGRTKYHRGWPAKWHSFKVE